MTISNGIMKRKKYTQDETYFEKIDSNEKAYFLGLMYSDGNVASSLNLFSINLQERDGPTLEKFRKSIKSDRELKLIKLSDKNENVQNQFNLSVYSNKMCLDLIKLGVVPRKSLILEFPTERQVPNEFLKSFMLGYYDGDGSFTLLYSELGALKISSNITSSKKFCYGYKKALNNQKISSAIMNRNNPLSGKLYINGNQSCFRFLTWMYSNELISMERKYKKYQWMRKVLLNNSVNDTGKFDRIEDEFKS